MVILLVRQWLMKTNRNLPIELSIFLALCTSIKKKQLWNLNSFMIWEFTRKYDMIKQYSSMLVVFKLGAESKTVAY